MKKTMYSYKENDQHSVKDKNSIFMLMWLLSLSTVDFDHQHMACTLNIPPQTSAGIPKH
ncbi:hypothetical protein RchiOBHm_Chr1g0316761 [Rosa chinensis]|uniref:Uncharacterized protein n=1 Tax=Rosa chinensis TaxID=74649 RepID=A0A2P6S7R2_ROSCH|nr:hypothetical protein RchiOBHm_Chr1g0316761 [Rosa chinensis]